MTNEGAALYPFPADGILDRWLACGPETVPLAWLDTVIRPNGSPYGREGRSRIANAPLSLGLKRRVYEELPRLGVEPGRAGSVPEAAGSPRVGGPGPGNRRRWEYRLTGEDRVVDFSLFNFIPTYMEAWVCALLVTETQVTLAAQLLTVGPAQVWLGGACLARYAEFGYMEPAAVAIQLPLRAGGNLVWIRGEMIGWREARLALGLRLPPAPSPVRIGIPLGDTDAGPWLEAERRLSRLQVRGFTAIESPLRIWLEPESTERVTAAAELALPVPAGTPAGFREEVGGEKAPDGGTERFTITVAPDAPAEVPVPAGFLERLSRLHPPLTVKLAVRPEPDCLGPGGSLSELSTSWPVYIPQAAFHREPGEPAAFEERRAEALERLATAPHDLMGAMAAVRTGYKRRIDPRVVAAGCHFLDQRCDCADFYALALLTALERFADSDALSDSDRRRIRDSLHGFKFWIDEPGVDAMCYFTENHQILFQVAALLAGQRWPEAVFGNSGLTGRRLQRRAARRIERWILDRLRGGFSEWDSNAYLTMDVYALLGLVELARSPRLRAMAETLLHKTLFMIACQSWRGVHGSSHGRCYVEALKSARLESTSGIQRLAWGFGGFGGESWGTGMLALAERYRVPGLISRIGSHLPALLVTRARSAGRYRPRFDLRSGSWEVATWTRRTPHYMLAAAVNQRPGDTGIQEHLWQATLSPEAVVFTSYPGNGQEHGNARPNFWAGSARLPRVAADGRTVLCLYRLVESAGLGFTHAYFPTQAFSKWAIHGHWAFARAGTGYLALWADGALRLTRQGRHAFQELRSDGAGLAWLCHCGSSAEDGDFASFCRRTGALKPQAAEAGGLPFVRWTEPQGTGYQLDWDGPFRVNGREQSFSYLHYDNLYTRTPVGASLMMIRHGESSLELDLRGGTFRLPNAAGRGRV